MLVDAIRAEGFRLSKNRTALFWSLAFVPIISVAIAALPTSRSSPIRHDGPDRMRSPLSLFRVQLCMETPNQQGWNAGSWQRVTGRRWVARV